MNRIAKAVAQFTDSNFIEPGSKQQVSQTNDDIMAYVFSKQEDEEEKISQDGYYSDGNNSDISVQDPSPQVQPVVAATTHRRPLPPAPHGFVGL